MTCFGPALETEGVRFRLWSPSAHDVAVEVQGIGTVALAAASDGWRDALIKCGPGARYRFRIGETVFPDPASRLQDGGVHGWSVVQAPPAQKDLWPGRVWEETVLYECHPGLMGGFRGIAGKLDGLAELGITAIELMPIAAFPGARNWGYDGVLPFAPAEAYGTPADLRDMIAAAHARGIMVFLDVVYNHFGPDGNYLPLYATPFFRADTSTPWGAAIDFRLPQVQAFFAENARMWLFEYGFDGLRFDAVHAIRDEGWLDRLAMSLRADAGARHIHLVLENEDNIASHLRPRDGKKIFDAQWNDDVHHAFHVLLTGETHGYYRDFSENAAALLSRALAEGFIYQGEVSVGRGGPRGEASTDLPPTAFVNFLQNHDQTGNRAFGERLTVLADPQALRAAVALLLLAPQIPMIFMGDEVGSRAPFLYFTDHGPQLAQAVREGRAREFAAFADPAHGKVIADPNAGESFAASDPFGDAPDADMWRALYKSLLALRHSRIVPHLKGVSPRGAEAIADKAILAAWRLGDGTRLTIAANLGTSPVRAILPEGEAIWGHPDGGVLAPMTTLAWIGR